MSATLAIAILGVALSVAALAWQFTTFVLNGPRVRVRLTVGLTDDDGKSTNAWSLPDDGQPVPLYPGSPAPTREIAIVSVFNRGRAATSIVAVGLACTRRESIRRRVHVAVVNDEHATLAPGHMRSWRFDVWPVVDALRDAAPDTDLRVTAAVMLGTGRYTFSPKGPALVVATSRTTIEPGAAEGHVPQNRAGDTRVIGFSRLRRWFGGEY